MAYIEREAVLQDISETVVFTVRKGTPLPNAEMRGANKVIDRIKSAKAADVVEVVRCRDCVHFQPYEGEEHKGDCAELVGLESCVYEEDFCSYGEAKMDGKGEGE